MRDDEMKHTTGVRWLAALACATLAAGTMAACADEGSEGAGYDDDSVRVGVVTSLSGAGALEGSKWRKGAEMAAKDINADGGIDGHKIKVIVQDDKTEPSASVAAMRKIVSEDPFAVLGSLQSSNTVVNAKVLKKAGIPQITGSESPAVLEQAPGNLFLSALNAVEQTSAVAPFVRKQKIKRMAVIYVNSEFGIAGAKAVRNLAKESGSKVVLNVGTELDQTSFQGEVARLQKAKPDGLFMYMQQEGGARLIQAIDRAGLKKSMTLLGNNVMVTGDTVDIAGAAANGISGVDDPPPTDPAFKEIAARFRQENPKESPSHDFLKGYVAMQAIKAGTQKAGELDREKFKKALSGATFCAKDYPGLRASVHWQRNGDLGRAPYLVSVENEQVKPTEKLPSPVAAKELAKCGE